MYKKNTDIYLLGNPVLRSFPRLNKEIKNVLPVHCIGTKRIQRSYLDSFDRRLYRSGYVLESDHLEEKHYLVLRKIRHNTCLTEVIDHDITRFYWDFPEGKLRSTLRSIVRERALIDFASLPVSLTTYELRDRYEKIISYCIVTGIYYPGSATGRKTLASYIELNPARGAKKHLAQAYELLVNELNLEDIEPLFDVFRKLHISPAENSEKTSVTLESRMPAQTALCEIQIANLSVMESNLQGIIEDVDTEFLHDFRVAARKSRTLITRVHDVFPRADIVDFKNTFSYLSEITSACRDMDVFLSAIRSRSEKLRPCEDTDMEPLVRFLHKNRKKEHGKLIAALGSGKVTNFFGDWRNFNITLQKSIPNNEKNSSPIILVANKSIVRNYRRLLKYGNLVNSNRELEAIHDLRKAGKQFRYLIESFSSLYREDDVEAVLKILKILQNNLGKIVDMHAQGVLLSKWKNKMLRRKTAHTATIVKIEELMQDSYKNKQSLISNVRKRFKQFSSKANQLTISNMLK